MLKKILWLATASLLLLFADTLFVKASHSLVDALISITPNQVQAAYQSNINNANICVNPVNIPDSELHWLYIPASAQELNTRVDYYFLGGQLIQRGAVDASSCPNGGLTIDGYANACGMSVTQDLVYRLQNEFDEAILSAWYTVGTPPVLLKQLIRCESQFWPGRWEAYHWGLGHLTYLGAHNALQWNYALFVEMCDLAYGGDCPHGIDPMVISGLLSILDAECPECEYKIDFGKADESVKYVAQSVLAYCNQSAQLVTNVTNRSAANVVDYATIWKLTLYNYNVGSVCVYNSLDSVYEGLSEEQQVTGSISWDQVVRNTTDTYCRRGIDYANRITEKYYNFPP